MNYKKGDKVRILNTKGTSHKPEGIDAMNALIGQTLTISSISNGEFFIEGWFWTEQNIELVEESE